MREIAIVGGGAAGMLCSVFAARQGLHVHLFEKNEKLGKKLYITGKGRCNVTNDCDPESLFRNIMSNPKFLYSAFYSFTPRDMMNFLKDEGLPLKVERGNRVFPVSDHSSDVIKTLEKAMKKAGVRVHLNCQVKEISSPGAGSFLLKYKENGQAGKSFSADALVIASGGLSYPATGSTGDGYRFARSFGHSLKEQSPSLVPLLTKEEYIPRMQGLSLKNTGLLIRTGKKKVFQDFGEMMFTHNGVTGPMILTASAELGKYLGKEPLYACLDLKPALDPEQLDRRILREFEAAQNKQFKNVIGSLFPSSLTPVIIELGPIEETRPVNSITKEERLSFGALVKAFPFTITGSGDFKEAIITRGGVSVKEISPGTMESKLVPDLYFIGEVLDLDALTGGFNLQIAWSTAFLCAQALADKETENTKQTEKTKENRD